MASETAPGQIAGAKYNGNLEPDAEFDRTLMSNAPTPQIPSQRFNWIVYLALVLVAWLVNYPGRLNPDTLDAITQSQNLGTLNDWQAPVVTWLFAFFTPVLGQPAGALLVQALLLFFYPAITPGKPHDRRIGIADAALAVGSGAFIVLLIAMAGVIIRDVVLIGTILCLLGVLDLSSNSSGLRGVSFWFALILLFIIFAARPTNFLMLGISGGTAAVFIYGVGRKFFLTMVLIVFVCAASFPVTNYVNRKVLGASNAMQETSLIIFDIAGISSDLKQNLFAELRGWPADEVQPPWECYTPKSFDTFKWGVCQRYAELFDAAMHRTGAPSEVQWWFSNVLRHPISYSKHRFFFTVELLKNEVHQMFGWYPSATNISENIDQISGAITHGVDIGGWTHGVNMSQRIQMWQPTIAFVPFSWFASRTFGRPTSVDWGIFFCVATLLWSWRNRHKYKTFDWVVVVSSSLGLGNIMMMIVFGVSDESRYLAPTIICGIVSLLRTIRAELEALKVGREEKKHSLN
jgi:hypothetical protein